MRYQIYWGAANAGGSGTSGQGDGNQPGYQGQIDGSQYANSYYGSGGGNGSGKDGDSKGAPLLHRDQLNKIAMKKGVWLCK